MVKLFVKNLKKSYHQNKHKKDTIQDQKLNQWNNVSGKIGSFYQIFHCAYQSNDVGFIRFKVQTVMSNKMTSDNYIVMVSTV